MLSKTILKYLQSLHHKKFRDEYGVFIAEGPKVVSEFLNSKQFRCKMICGIEDWLHQNEKLIQPVLNENIYQINERELERISLLQTPNKVMAVFFKKEARTVNLKNSISLMLYEIQDPGNMGTIVRTADWFGIKNIICSENCADAYNPKVVQSSMGSLGRVNVMYTNIEKFLQDNNSINIYAATLEGASVYSLAKFTEGIIVIGNESNGINSKILQYTFKQITIPKSGEAESLNAAVATGIVLSHILK
jgi:TrmH family RNA methyltransferase